MSTEGLVMVWNLPASSGLKDRVFLAIGFQPKLKKFIFNELKKYVYT